MGYPFVLDVSEEAKVQTEPREIKDKDNEGAVDNITPTVDNYTQLYTIYCTHHNVATPDQALFFRV